MRNERGEYNPRNEIIEEIEKALASHRPGEIDWITFVGSGETTLHSGIGWLIRQVKQRTQLPVAVITNGALLYQKELRAELLPADAVLPSLDAGNEKLYRKINRPHPALPFQKHIEGLIAFRDEFMGKLWVEVMLVNGFNDSTEALTEIKTQLESIRPDEVHIVLPTRPAVETWVKPPDEEGLLRASAILGDVARLFSPVSGEFSLDMSETPADAILSIITRHPMREEELVETLRCYSSTIVTSTLQELEESGKAQVVTRSGIRYWCSAVASFPPMPPEK